MRTIVFAAVIAAGCLSGALAGCSSDSDNTNNNGNQTGNDGGPKSDGSTTPGNDGSTTPGNDGGTSDDGSATTEAGAKKAFGILVTQYKSAGTTGGSVGAALASDTATAPATGCTRQTTGDCILTKCDLNTITPDGGGTDAGVPKVPSAGELTVKGKDTVTLTPDANGLYAGKTVTSALFDGTTQLEFTAKGAEIGAFTSEKLAAPGDLTLSSPACSGSCGDLDRTADFIVKWSGATAGKVYVSIMSFDLAAKKSATVLCGFDATKNQGTLPKAMLGELTATAAGSFSVQTSMTRTFSDGEYDINLTASSSSSGTINVK